jgi:triosephosphate isomerase (TIM)
MIIVANWKAYVEDLAKAKKLFAVSKKLAKETKNEIILAPPAPFVGVLSARNKSSVAFAAQDISATVGGARTGEITAQAYAAAGATYAIIGHSERRSAGDTDSLVSEKLAHAFAHGLTPILCVGEKERDGDGKYLSLVREELTSDLSQLTQKERSKIIVAYEPIWAIGKMAENAIGPDDLTEMILYIRKVLAEICQGKGSTNSPIIYGGSVEPENIRALAAATDIGGFLVGHTSVDPSSFELVVKQLS